MLRHSKHVGGPVRHELASMHWRWPLCTWFECLTMTSFFNRATLTFRPTFPHIRHIFKKRFGRCINIDENINNMKVRWREHEAAFVTIAMVIVAISYIWDAHLLTPGQINSTFAEQYI